MLKDNFHCKFINRSKKIISFYNNKKFDPKRSSNFYFDSTSDSNDYTSLKYFFKKVLFFKYLKLIIKDTLYSVFYGNPIIYNGDLTKKKYDKIIVSWANKKNFKLDGSHQDKFFNINSKKDKSILWFLITNEQPPKKIQKNVVVLQLRSGKKLYILKFLKSFILNLKIIFKDFRFFVNSISCNTYISQNILHNFMKFIHTNVTHILMPYEGQPFQNEIFRFAKERNKKIKTIGYIHSPPLALPTKFIYKHGSPDQLILNGVDQYKCFRNFLGWKSKKMKVLPSARFHKSKDNLGGFIFLPLTIRSEYNIVEGMKSLIEKKYINPNDLIIRNHPTVENSLKHTNLIFTDYSTNLIHGNIYNNGCCIICTLTKISFCK